MDDPTNSTPEPAPPSDDQAVSQSDIDALFGGEGEDPSPGSPPGGDPDAGSAQEVNQADVDALMEAAGAAPSGSPAAGEDAPAESAADSRTDTLGRPFDEAAAAMQAAMDAEKDAAVADGAASSAPPPASGQPVTLPDFEGVGAAGIDPQRVTMLNDINLRVKIQLGQSRMLVEDVLKLAEGSVVELDKLAGDPVDLFVNDRLIARGEVLVLNDNFCVRISEVLSNDPHRVLT